MDMTRELKQWKSVQTNVMDDRQCLLSAPTISALQDVILTDSVSVSVKLVLLKRGFATRCPTTDIVFIDLGRQVYYFRGIFVKMKIIMNRHGQEKLE